jgi:hypothetical protein
MTLDWILDMRTIPVEITKSLQEIADRYHYSADQMHSHKRQIIDVLDQQSKGYVVAFLFPHSLDDDETWIQSLVCMEIRRLYFLTRGEEHGFTIYGRRMHKKGK